MTSRILSPLVLGLLLIFLIGPFLIIIAASLSAGETLAFPPQGLSLRWVLKVFTIESFRDSFAMSMMLAIGGTLNSEVILGQENVGKAMALLMVVVVAGVMTLYAAIDRRASRWLAR